MSDSDVSQIQVKFVTKHEKYSIPDTPFSVPVNLDADSLSSLVNSLISNNGSGDSIEVLFDFLLSGIFLRTSLNEHIDQHIISTEDVIEIEYIERLPSPEPQDSLIHDDWVSAVHSFDKYILTGCYDNTLKLWRTDGASLLTIPGHIAAVRCVKWITKDKNVDKLCFVSGSHDETTLLWQWNRDTNEVECKQSCKGHAASVDCIAVNPNATKFCTGSYDTMLKIWNAEPEGSSGETGETPAKKTKSGKSASRVPTRVPMKTMSGHKEGITSTEWIDTNVICSASMDHTIRLWDVERGQETSKINGVKVFFDMSYNEKTKTLITASSDRHIRLYDPRITDGQVVKSTFSSHNGWVSSVHWSPDNEDHFISGSFDHLVKLWDRRSPKAPLFDLKGHEERVLAVDWSISGIMLSGGADNHLKVFTQK